MTAGAAAPSPPATDAATLAAYGIDGRPASRERFYAAACDPRRSVVVEACAGAGKTWMLVSRILRALLDGAEPQQVLAITFTRKAAGEMRQRLDEWLALYSDASPAAVTDPGAAAQMREQALMLRGLSAGQARALAPALGALHGKLLQAGRAVEVQTFHAWFAQLLAHAPLALLRSLGLPAAYELLEDRQPLRDALLRRFHRRVQGEPALRALYVGMVRRHGRGSLLRWLDAAWTAGSDIARADAAGTLADAVPPAAARWAECEGLIDPAELLAEPALRADLHALQAVLARGAKLASDAAARLGAGLALLDAPAADAGPAAGAGFEAAWQALFTDKGEPRKRMVGAADEPLWLQVTSALESIQRMRLQQQAHDDQRAMTHLARVLLAEYARLKRLRGLVDMDDLERAAGVLLADGEAAAWVQERLDLRVRHLLIDEFQDTSPAQWQALEAWLAAYAGAGGGASGQRPLSVFIVGDPKQSIYRFRGAEPRVFSAARRFVVDGLDGLALECDHTRRNAPAVIEALNAVFGAVAQDGWGPFRPHTTESAEPGAVRALPGVPRAGRAEGEPAAQRWRDSLTERRREPEQQRRAEEAAQVARAVAELIGEHGFAPGQIMVLSRRRAPLGEVAQALAAAGIPHALAEPLVLTEVPEVLDLVALLDVLVSPGHDLALARALKSPIFGAGDDELLQLAQAAAARASGWLDALLAGAPDIDSAPLQRARRLLGSWRDVVHRLPPHDLLDRIVHEGEVLERMAAAAPAARRAFALQALQALLGAALEHDGARFASAYGFVRELRAGRVGARRALPACAVQLLTVHGAKGLEARAVLLLDCDPNPVAQAGPLVLVDWPAELPAPRCVAFVRSPRALPPSLRDTWDSHLLEAAREETNGLYVAMTRACEWLVFSRTEPRNTPSQPSWWNRVQAHAAVWDPAPLPDGPGGGLGSVTVETLPMLVQGAALAAPAALAALAAPDALVAPDAPLPAGPAPAAADDARAARLGRALHRVLEWAGRPGAPLSESAWPGACAAAAAEFGLPARAAGELLAGVRRILASPVCAAFFAGPALRWAGNEVTLAHEGELLRIDRLVALGAGQATTWWVLDYKLDRDPAARPEYREQLARYKAAVAALQPAAAVRAAFVTADGQLIEP